MALQMSFGGGDITGKLRDGAEERIRASSLSGIDGKRIVIESVTVHYRLEDRPKPWGRSEGIRILPEEPGEMPDVQAKRFDDWAV